MRRFDADGVAEPRNMSDPHAAAVVEIDDLRGVAEAKHVRREHTMMRRQCGDIALPPDLGADAELTAVQQDDRITLSRFEIAGHHAIDQDGLARDLSHAVSQAARANVSSWVASRSS